MNKLKKFLYHFFVPHEGNNFRAKALHIDFLTYYLILAIFLSFAYKTVGSNFGNVLGYATDITVDKLYQLTNSVRQQNSLPVLSYNEKLALAAQKKRLTCFLKTTGHITAQTALLPGTLYFRQATNMNLPEKTWPKISCLARGLLMPG